MLVICNGAAKSGSTWLYNIAVEAFRPTPLPLKWRRPDWINASIHPDQLASYIATEQSGETHVVKAHYYGLPAELKRALLSSADLRILNVSRDIRDAVVSHYHYWQKQNSSDVGFGAYFEQAGMSFVVRTINYHRYWDVRSPNYHRFSYEGLLGDFTAAIRGAGEVFPSLGDPDARVIERATDRVSLSQKYSASEGTDMSWFFRAGRVGDWRFEMPAEIERRVRALVANLGEAYGFYSDGSGLSVTP